MQRKLLRDITNQVATRLSVNKKDTYMLGEQIFREIMKEIGEGNSIMIYECGVFMPRLTKGRDLSYFTKKQTSVESYYTPKFVFSDKIKEEIKSKLNN